MRVPALAAIFVTALAIPALAASKAKGRPAPQDLTLESVNRAELSAKASQGTSTGISPVMIKAQVLLDRARFSPGVIDGRNGENVRKAVAAFERARQLDPDGELDHETLAKLGEASGEPVLIEYTIEDADVKGPFAERIPEKFEEMAGLDRLAYTGPEELLAEKFHMDQDLLEALNPGKSFDKAGTTVLVANVRGETKDGQPQKIATIEVDKRQRVVQALAEDGSLVAVYPASIGSEEKPAPDGTHEVRAVARNPTYTYNPDYDFKGVKAKEKFEIKAGPNNPVGSVWIDLSVETFGIHGTPEPEKVGKSYSHGCVRLTNWDAEELARMVRKGTKVVFKE
jgi:lipoprotein-anchoring transpeptidase ErfK/SrfK